MLNHLPSDTAILVARSILLAAEDGTLRSLMAAGETEILERIPHVRHSRWFDFAMNHAWARKMIFAGERRLLPGIIAHYLVRKRRIEMAVREALDSGVRQVVILGAGFDTLAWRLHGEFPATIFLELDHPATQDAKRSALPPAPNLFYGQVDLSSETLGNALNACPRFSPEQSSVFVAEGLTMYLSVSRVTALMREFSRLAGPAGRVIFTFMEEDASGSIGFRGESPWISRWLSWRSEPFLWGISRANLPAFLASNGLGSGVVIDDVQLSEQILAPCGLPEIPLARGECICLCSPIPS